MEDWQKVFSWSWAGAGALKEAKAWESSLQNGSRVGFYFVKPSLVYFHTMAKHHSLAMRTTGKAWLQPLKLTPLILMSSLPASEEPIDNSLCPVVIPRHTRILLWRGLAGVGQSHITDLMPMSSQICPRLVLCIN